MTKNEGSLTMTKVLKHAYCDLIFLLDRDYPKKSALTFVANHYNLNKKFRNILNRAALPKMTVKRVQSNLVRDPVLLKGRDFHIDTYNQLITFFSLVNHDPVIICRDGVLRDIFSSIHSKNDLEINRELLSHYFVTLSKLKPGNLHFYFDRQRSHSKNHARFFSALLQEFDLLGVCEVHKAVDWSLKKQTKALVFSHDTAVLAVAPQCFDFSSWFFNLTFSYDLSQQLSLNFQSISCN